jgi:hypothetical protein
MNYEWCWGNLSTAFYGLPGFNGGRGNARINLCLMNHAAFLKIRLFPNLLLNPLLNHESGRYNHRSLQSIGTGEACKELNEANKK